MSFLALEETTLKCFTIIVNKKKWLQYKKGSPVQTRLAAKKSYSLEIASFHVRWNHSNWYIKDFFLFKPIITNCKIVLFLKNTVFFLLIIFSIIKISRVTLYRKNLLFRCVVLEYYNKVIIFKAVVVGTIKISLQNATP